MYRRPAKKLKRQKGNPKSDNDSVASDFSTASKSADRFMDSKGVVKINRLPIKYQGKSVAQIALALLKNPTGPEAVTAITLSEKSKSEFRARTIGEFASREEDKNRISIHLSKVDMELGAINAEGLKLHSEMSRVSARLSANFQTSAQLKAQKQRMESDLEHIANLDLVHKSILGLFDLLDPNLQAVLPFQDLPLQEIAARLLIQTWAQIAALSFNATHRAISVCNVLGLSRNERFKAVWNATDEVRPEWFRLFGEVPNVRTGRDHPIEACKVRLGVYLGIQPPEAVMDRVLSALAAGSSDSAGSLSDIVEEGEESESEEATMPIPGNIQVGGKKRPRSFSLKSVEQLQEQMERLKEEMARRQSASASTGEDAGEDNNDDGEDNNDS